MVRSRHFSGQQGGRRALALLPYLLILATVFAVYANAWPNALVHDDKLFAGSERAGTLSDIPRFFTEDAWAARAMKPHLYRPLLRVSLALDAAGHGNWYAGYHLTNIGLHALVTLLLFAFLLRLLRRLPGPSGAEEPQATRRPRLGESSEASGTRGAVRSLPAVERSRFSRYAKEGKRDSYMYAALLVSLLFAVHPAHTEVVDSVFNRSALLAAAASLSGLLWLLKYLESHPARAWAGLAVAFLFAVLSRETGIVLPGIAVILVLAVTPGDVATRLRKCLPALWLLIPLALYAGLRANALTLPDMPDHPGLSLAIDDAPGGAPANTDKAAGASSEAPAAAADPAIVKALKRFRVPDGRRLLYVSGFWFESFKFLLWPRQPSTVHRGIPPSALIAGLLTNCLLLVIALSLARRGHFGMALGLGFFYLATLPASRVIGDPGVMPHLAERYLYFPSVGLAIALAFGLRHAGLNSRALLPAAVAVAAGLLLASVTWSRNADWVSDVKLYESEYGSGHRGEGLLLWLTAAYLAQGQWSKAEEICDRHISDQENAPRLSSHCGLAYARTGRLADAEKKLAAAAAFGHAEPMARVNLALFYLNQGRWKDAKDQFEMAVKAEKLPARRAWLQGHMRVRLYPSDRQKLLEARAYFEQALELEPAYTEARQQLRIVNRALGSPR